MTETAEVDTAVGGDAPRGRRKAKAPAKPKKSKGSKAPPPLKRDKNYAELPPSLDIKKIRRPSKYDQSYCDVVIELGAQGKSKAQMAASIGVARSTFALWEREYPAFSAAVKAAMDLSLSWWEEAGQLNMRPGFNATAYIFQMKNRFSADYKDRQEQALDLSDPLLSLLSSIDGKSRGIPTGS